MFDDIDTSILAQLESEENHSRWSSEQEDADLRADLEEQDACDEDDRRRKALGDHEFGD